MKRMVFFDTETTGHTDRDWICQLAYKTGEEKFFANYRPPIRIPPEASAVHHLTNKMVAERPLFRESAEYAHIKKLFEADETVLVAHNACFDIAMIKKEGIQPKNFICTLRVARHLDTEEKISQFKLQYLRYLLELEVEARAHDALSDVLVVEELYKRLAAKVSLEEMLEISSHPSIIRTLNFGKYKGKKVSEVLTLDRGWLEWLLGEKLKSPELDEDWIYTLKQCLGVK